MTTLYVFILLPIIIITTFYFNEKKFKGLGGLDALVIIIQSILVFNLSMCILFQGFVSTITGFSVLIVISILLLITILLIDKSGLDNYARMLRGVGSSFLFIGKTVYSLYLFLTMFRYMDPALQIVLSTTLTIAVYYFVTKLSKAISIKYGDFKIALQIPGNTIKVVIPVVLIILSVIFFNFPTTEVSKALNLDNNDPFLNISGLPTDISNDFNLDKITEFKLDNIDTGYHLDVSDYYKTDKYLYTYSNQLSINILDLETGSLIRKQQFSDPAIKSHDRDDYSNYNFKFVEENFRLLLFASDGLYEVDGDTFTKLSNESNFNAELFHYQDHLYLLTKDEDDNQLFMIFKNDTFEATTEFTILDHTQEFIVISDSLFYISGLELFMVGTSNVFDYELGEKVYDATTNRIYLSTFSDLSIREDHLYSYISPTETQSIDLVNQHNDSALITNELIYYVPNTNIRLSSVEIFNKELEPVGFIDLKEPSKFIEFNDYKRTYIAGYKLENDMLEFLMINQDGNLDITYELYQVSSDVDKVGLILPFYSHYGLYSLTLLLIILFIPFPPNESIIESSGVYDTLQKLSGRTLTIGGSRDAAVQSHILHKSQSEIDELIDENINKH